MFNTVLQNFIDADNAEIQRVAVEILAAAADEQLVEFLMAVVMHEGAMKELSNKVINEINRKYPSKLADAGFAE